MLQQISSIVFILRASCDISERHCCLQEGRGLLSLLYRCEHMGTRLLTHENAVRNTSVESTFCLLPLNYSNGLKTDVHAIGFCCSYLVFPHVITQSALWENAHTTAFTSQSWFQCCVHCLLCVYRGDRESWQRGQVSDRQPREGQRDDWEKELWAKLKPMFDGISTWWAIPPSTMF